MHLTHFHLCLTTALSIGLGYALSSTPASGYPAGAAVSTGNNPIRSVAGSMSLSSETSRTGVLAAPSTHDLIITDVLTGLNQNSDYCDGNGMLAIVGDDGVEYAQLPVYMTHMDNAHPTATTLQAISGIRIPTGVSVSVQWTWTRQQCGSDSYHLSYNIAGYLSEP